MEALLRIGTVAAVVLLGPHVSVRGQQLLKDLEPGSGTSEPLFSAHSFVDIGDRALFVAETAAHGREVWVTDGTEQGTIVLDLAPGPEGEVDPALARVGDRGIFVSLTPQPGLWSTDGTLAGTRLVLPLPLVTAPGSTGVPPVSVRYATRLTSRGELLVIVSESGQNWLCATDGTPGFGSRVALTGGIRDVRVASTGEAFVIRYGFAPAVWQTDGTAQGTTQIWSGANTDTVYFAQADVQRQLYWVRQPQSSTSMQLLTLPVDLSTPVVSVRNDTSGYTLEHFGETGLLRYAPRTTGPVSGLLDVLLSGPTPGPETLLATFVQRAILPLGVDSPTGSRVFARWNGTFPSDSSLWETDGTVAGTRPVFPFRIRMVEIGRLGDGHLVFSDHDFGVPDPPHLYDGAETTPLFDLLPALDGLRPADLTYCPGLPGGPAVLSSAEDAAHGREPWIVPVAALGVGGLETVRSTDCVAPAGRERPRIESAGGPPLLGSSTFELRLEAPSHVGAATAFVFGLELTPRDPALTCDLPIGLSFAVPTGTVPPGGTLRLPISIPNVPSNLGLRLFTTSLVLQPGGTLLGLADRSDIQALVVATGSSSSP